MLYQNSPSVSKIIVDIGCFYRSCLRIPEIELNKEFSVDELNELWAVARGKGFINEKDDVVNSAGIANIGFNHFNSDKRLIEVGLFKIGVTDFYSWVKDRRIDYLIQKVKTVNQNDHFRVVDHRGKVIFDPYYPQPEIESIYYSILYQVV